MWRLWFALDELVRRPYLSQNQMRVVLGHLVDTLCLRRELLAILCLSYTFVGKGGDAVVKLPKDVVNEMEICRDLLPLVFTDLAREPLPRMYCSDASGVGYALHSAPVSVPEFWEATAFRGRWRFASRRDPAPHETRAAQGLGADLDCAPKFQAWVDAELAAEEEARHHSRHILVR